MLLWIRRRPMPARCGSCCRPFWHDALAIAGGRRERAVVGDELLVRSRHERAESLEERQRIEHDVGRAIAPALLQRVGDAAVGQHGEPVVGDGRACDVVDQVFETIGSVGGDAGRGVQREAVEVVAEALRGLRADDALRAAPGPAVELAAPFARRRSSPAPKRRGPAAGRSPARCRRVRRVQPAVRCCATTAAPGRGPSARRARRRRRSARRAHGTSRAARRARRRTRRRRTARGSARRVASGIAPLHEDDRPGPCARQAARCLAQQTQRHSAHEQRAHRAQDCGIVGAQHPQRVRQRQHPACRGATLMRRWT